MDGVASGGIASSNRRFTTTNDAYALITFTIFPGKEVGTQCGRYRRKSRWAYIHHPNISTTPQPRWLEITILRAGLLRTTGARALVAASIERERQRDRCAVSALAVTSTWFNVSRHQPAALNALTAFSRTRPNFRVRAPHAGRKSWYESSHGFNAYGATINHASHAEERLGGRRRRSVRETVE